MINSNYYNFEIYTKLKKNLEICGNELSIEYNSRIINIPNLNHQDYKLKNECVLGNYF